MIVKLSEILKANVLLTPDAVREPYVVIRKGADTVRVRMDVDVTPNVFGLKRPSGWGSS